MENTKEEARKWFVEECIHSFDEFVSIGMWGDYGGLNDKGPFYDTLVEYADHQSTSQQQTIERFRESLKNIIENYKKSASKDFKTGYIATQEIRLDVEKAEQLLNTTEPIDQ